MTHNQWFGVWAALVALGLLGFLFLQPKPVAINPAAQWRTPKAKIANSVTLALAMALVGVVTWNEWWHGPEWPIPVLLVAYLWALLAFRALGWMPRLPSAAATRGVVILAALATGAAGFWFSRTYHR